MAPQLARPPAYVCGSNVRPYTSAVPTSARIHLRFHWPPAYVCDHIVRLHTWSVLPSSHIRLRLHAPPTYVFGSTVSLHAYSVPRSSRIRLRFHRPPAEAYIVLSLTIRLSNESNRLKQPCAFILNKDKQMRHFKFSMIILFPADVKSHKNKDDNPF